MKSVLGLMVVAGMAASAAASTVNTTFTSFGTASFTNKDSVATQGNAANATDTWVAAAGGSVNAIRVNGTLNKIISGTFASEARVRMTAGAGNAFTAFNFQASTTSSFTNPHVVSRQVAVTPFTLAPGNVNFEWFESFDDGAGADANWADVSYEFGNGTSTIVNGNVNVGALAGDGSTYHYDGSHVSGGLDFFTFTIGGVNNASDFLSIRMNAGATGSMTDTEVALYDSLGNLVATDDDGGPGLYSLLTFGAADPYASPDTTPGDDGLTLAAGAYTLVTGGFNTNFTANIANIVAGTNAGTYSLDMNYSVPAPGALALLGLGGLIAGRRRR